jgi:hypothetical protein
MEFEFSASSEHPTLIETQIGNQKDLGDGSGRPKIFKLFPAFSSIGIFFAYTITLFPSLINSEISEGD